MEGLTELLEASQGNYTPEMLEDALQECRDFVDGNPSLRGVLSFSGSYIADAVGTLPLETTAQNECAKIESALSASAER
jgi:hypothetical protein